MSDAVILVRQNRPNLFELRSYEIGNIKQKKVKKIRMQGKS